MPPVSRALGLVVLLAAPAVAQTPLGTAFTYQGRLTDAGGPASGSFDFQLALFDAATLGAQVGATLDHPAVAVANGLFTVSLDFGPAAAGPSARWLEVRVRPAGGGTFTPFASRQRLTPGPNALFATNADLLDSLNSTQLLRSDQNGTLTGSLTVTAGLSATSTTVGGVGVRGTGPGSVFGDGVVGTTGSAGRGVVAQNTSAGVALLASSAAGDHVSAATSIGIATDPVFRVTNGGALLSEGPIAAGHAVAAGTPAPAFSSFGNAANKDETGISTANDVYVEGGLEVDGAAYVDGSLRLGGTSDTDNDTIYFDTGTEQSITWDDNPGEFLFSRGLRAGWFDSSGGGFGGSNFDLTINHRDDVDVMVDNDADGIGDAEWWRQSHDPPTNFNQLGALRSGPTAADRGDLLIRGQLTTGFSFDVAERFRNGDDVEPGELVRVDPDRPDAVRRTRGEGDAAVLGVVSTDPALLIGGTTFDAGALGAWGEDLEQQFRGEQDSLEAEVLSEQPALRALLDRARTTPPTPTLGHAVDPVERAQGKVTQRALERFASRHLASIALAGRVPVRVDSSFGEIRVGDLLAPSPIPGVAMKARRDGPVVGTALESFSGGRGTVLMFVHRSHYSPPADDRVAALEARIERLERALSSAGGGAARP